MALLDAELRVRLIAAALDAQQYAYAPYSHYPVGAALLTSDGRIFTGCNVENAGYSGTICAERTAAVKAVSEGAQIFEAVVVITSNGVFPCGVCRQVLFEFGRKMWVIAADMMGNVVDECSLADLLPHGFGPKELDEGLNPDGKA